MALQLPQPPPNGLGWYDLNDKTVRLKQRLLAQEVKPWGQAVPTPAGVQFALDQGCEPAYADLEEGDAIFCKLPRSRKLGLWLLRRL